MKHLNILLLLVFAISISACSSAEQENEVQQLDDYPNAELLVSASSLSDMIAAGEELMIVDARNETDGDLIQGAVHFPAVSSLIDEDHPIEFYMIGPDRFQELMRGIGLDVYDRVVIYDAGNGLSAARLFYALDYYGFSNASVLNGGIQSWKDMDGELSESAATLDEGTFEVSVQETLMCDFEYVTAAAESDDTVIFDARSLEEYTGQDERAAQSGHVPNAVHLVWNSVLEPEGIPYFLPANEIQEKYTALGITPDKEVIPHCHTNVRGSHAYFTLRLMGYDSVRPYEGSWSDYGNREGATVSQ